MREVCYVDGMNRWLLKNKEDFAAWRNAADHIGKPQHRLDEVGTPSLYPIIIVWFWYTTDTGAGNTILLQYTAVSPQDFVYYVP